MRVAALYDIHGNIDALDAVLVEIEPEGIDLILIGGDIAWGPHPAETVTRVQELGERARVIRGNADRELVQPESVEPGWVADVNRWCRDQLTQNQRQFLSDLPEIEVATVGKMGEVLFCHATPRSDEEIFTAITPEDVIAEMLREATQDLVVCGHTHSQFDRDVAGRRVVNAGSVGLPYEDAPGAYWAMIGDEIVLKRSDYDFAGAAARIRQSDCPYSDQFADDIVAPPSRAETTQFFEKRRPDQDRKGGVAKRGEHESSESARSGG